MSARIRDLSLLRNVQTGSAANPASYSVGMGALLPWVQWQGSEADHLPPSGAEVAHIHAFMVYIGTTTSVFLMLCRSH
jgi:hypothetical protein